MSPAPLDVDRLRAADDLVTALREEQIARWSAGDRTPAEAFLAAFPDLPAEDAQVLVVGEMLLRWDAGEAPTADEYARRFPVHADDLRCQFELQGSLDGPMATIPAPELSSDPVSIPGYVVTGHLGRGRWATVYLARHLVLGRPVAIKLFNPAQALEPQFAVRFLEEARILAKLEHPHIVRVYDSGSVGPQLYMVLEYAPHGTLADTLKAGPLPVEEAVAVVAKVARAAGLAHAHAIVHRDIKPSNILLNRHGEPLLADFGLAKDVALGLGLTAPGVIVGTPVYMAPEQARQEPGTLGPPADVYALGTVLYELLTGAPPFMGKSIAQTFRMIQDDTPASLAAGVPAWVDAVVIKCLTKGRDGRYPDGTALADALEAGAVAEPTSQRRWWKWW